MGSIHETRGQKSRATVPLRTKILMITSFFGPKSLILTAQM